MIVYQIRLPKKQDAEAFVKFMLEEYFPAVHKGPTRIGQVTDLMLLRREIEGDDCGESILLARGVVGSGDGRRPLGR